MEKYPKAIADEFNGIEGERSYKNLVFTFNLNSVDKFNEAAQILLKYDYIYRGQRCYCDKWKLQSSFDRKYPNIGNRRKDKLYEIFEKFVQKLGEIRNFNDIDFKEDTIWAIGQHYGLPTPLLDWTKSPYIAAFFAFYKTSDDFQTENRVIYGLSRGLKLLLNYEKQRYIEFDNELEIVKENLQSTQNKRLENQQGELTKALQGLDIKSIVDRFSRKVEGKEYTKGEIFLAELLIPDKMREEVLSFLRKREISHGTLFPDYAGAVEITKQELMLV